MAETEVSRMLEKPIDEIREDIFLRPDAFQHEAWYADLTLYTRLGVCQPDPSHVADLRKALKLLGYPTHTGLRNEKLYVLPGERKPARTQKAPRQEWER